MLYRVIYNLYFFLFRYGLLGPSGCGKTTLLSSIVGRSELDSGDIKVKAFKREDIGYMPQVRIKFNIEYSIQFHIPIILVHCVWLYNIK